MEMDLEIQTDQGRKRREESPEPSHIKWRTRPTFLAPGGRNKGRKEEQKE